MAFGMLDALNDQIGNTGDSMTSLRAVYRHRAVQ
jgi:hypothetical protein